MKSNVPDDVLKKLVPGKMFRLEGDNPANTFTHEKETITFTYDVVARFLGVDADIPDELGWVWSMEWVEDGLPVARIIRCTDFVLARTTITEV